MSALDAAKRENAALRQRIATLSAAILRIGASLDLDTVLRGAVDGARALTGARYGRVATVDEAGAIEAFIAPGLTPLAEPRGVHRITRHPVFVGVTVMALAHGVANGHASDVAFFGGTAVFALTSSRYQDLRKLAGGDAAFRRLHAATAFAPFTRRGVMRGLRELSPLAVGLGLAVALAARCLHPSTRGCGLLQ